MALLLHLDRDDHVGVVAAGLVVDLHGLEEAERRHPLLAAAQPAAAEELALVHAELAADDLVPGLGVAGDLDPLDGLDLRPSPPRRSRSTVLFWGLTLVSGLMLA